MTRTDEEIHGSGTGGLLSRDGLPDWLGPVDRAARTVRPEQLSRFLPPASGAGRQSAVLVLFGEGERGPELLLMERAGESPLARRTALLPRRRPRPRGRRHGGRRAAARRPPRGPGGDRTRPRGRPALRRPAPALHPGQRLRRHPRPRLVARPEPRRRRRPRRDRQGLHRPRGGSHGPRQPRDGRPPERPPGPRVPRRIRAGLGFYRRSDRPAAALLRLGAPLGPVQAGPARLALMTG